MSTVPLPEFQIQTPQQLADYLIQAQTWQEVENLTRAFTHFKAEAWSLLSKAQQNHIFNLKRWKDHAIAQKFPLGCTVQRRNDPEKKQGEVKDYWQAHGIDYVTFEVDGFTDWCRASALKRIYERR